MKCPVCDIEMRVSDREGVEIDHCPQCRGVWLTRRVGKNHARAESQEFGGRRHDEDDHDDDHDSHRRSESESRRDSHSGRRRTTAADENARDSRAICLTCSVTMALIVPSTSAQTDRRKEFGDAVAD